MASAGFEIDVGERDPGGCVKCCEQSVWRKNNGNAVDDHDRIPARSTALSR